MDIKQLTEKLSKSSTSNNGKYVPWWSGWENDSMCRYDLFSAEEIAETDALIATATAEELTAPVCAYKYTLFHLLVWHNFYNAVRSVVERKIIDADVTDGGGKGVTPLMLACFYSNHEMFKLLVGAGADMTKTDGAGRTCWHYLSGARPELSWRYHCREQSYDQIGKIADALPSTAGVADAEGRTPMAVMLKDLNNEVSSRLIDKLLAKGAKTDFKDDKGNSPLMIAIKNNHNTVALRLANDKTLINLANDEGETPLHAADDFRKIAVSLLLMANGAKGGDRYAHMSLRELSQETSNAFAFHKENDNIAPALYLTQKLINTVDEDDDDEIECVAEIMGDALGHDEDCSVLDMLKKAGIGLTEKFSSRGRVWCLRDKCFTMRAGIGAIKKLIDMGVDINSAVIDGRTPVNIVADEPEPNRYYGEKVTYFEDAARLFDGESATVLDNGGSSAMHTAAWRGHSEMLRVMAERGADVNVTQDAPADAGSTPLHLACEMCNVEAVKTLIELGADDGIKNVDGITAAHIIIDKNKCRRNSFSDRDYADKRRLQILGMLKNIDEPRGDGMTPLMIAQYEYINFISAAQAMLLAGGADVNRRDSRGRTALMIAADEHCFKDTIKELVRAGAELDAADRRGRTALHYALEYGSQDVARFLIKKGADYNIADNDGATAATLAAEKGYDTVLELMTDIK